MKLLLKRLSNEEEELRKESISFSKIDYYVGEKPKKIEVFTVYGPEKVPVVRKYTVKFVARGFVKKGYSIVPQWDHVASIYILRHYPIPNPKDRLGAPVRITWESDIFHPNIAPGPLYGGNGVVCWGILKKWLKTITLLQLIRGLQMLVQNPNPDDPIHNPPICLEAAEYFKKYKPVSWVIRDKK